jgi:multicomponent Na+:H+ antiporter subunit F
MLNLVTQYFVMPVLAIVIALAFYRLVRGPSVADRVVALDLMSTIGLALIAAYALYRNQPPFLDVGIVLALIGFLGTVAFAYYIERRA